MLKELSQRMIITIIVIVVLATAVILSIANNNPIDNAKKAKTAYNQKTLEEAANIEYATIYADKKTKGEAIDYDEITATIRNNLKVQGFSETDVAKVTVNENGVIIKDTTISEAITFTKTGELVLGNEVTASNGEEFYVIGGDTVGTEISTSTKDILLLSKYNLKVEDEEITLKQDTSGGSNVVVFSSTNYWSNVEGITYPADLNDEEKYSIGSGNTSIITTAKEYGTSLGVTGRLMTYEEARVLETSYQNILFGKTTTNSNLLYWLSSANSISDVWFINGSSSFLYSGPYMGVEYNDEMVNRYGVRPVITVSKSLIN